MSLELARRRVIRHQQDREIAKRPKPSEHRADDQLVDALDRFLLQIGTAHVTGFVRRLDMQQQEVARLERFEAVAPLGGIVGIEKTGGAGNLNQVEISEPSQAVDEIDCRYDRAVDAEAFLQSRHRGPRALPPKPYRRGLGFAGGASRLVYRMLAQNRRR